MAPARAGSPGGVSHSSVVNRAPWWPPIPSNIFWLTLFLVSSAAAVLIAPCTLGTCGGIRAPPLLALVVWFHALLLDFLCW